MKSRHWGIALLLFLSACSSQSDPGATVRTDPSAEKHGDTMKPIQIQFPPASEEVIQKPDPSAAAAETKGTMTTMVREDDTTRPPTYADVVRLQKAVVANNRTSEVERERLAVLHLLANELLASEELMDTVKTPEDPLMELVSVYLSDRLGEHQEAEQRLAKFMERWRLQKGLTLGRALLCEKVQGYRRYVPSPTSVLKAGTAALIYVEIHNFTVKPSQDRHVMHLRYSWELLDDKGTAVGAEWLQKVKPEEREVYVEFNDVMTDYHQNFNFPLPQNLPMGKYSIKITAEDVHTGKKASTAVEFHVQAR